MARAALMTIGLLHAPWGDARVQGFEQRLESTFSAAETSPGYIDRSKYEDVSETSPWGPETYPASFEGEGNTGRIAPTLSVWQDLESMFAFAYSGPHAEALSKRKEWFEHTTLPKYVVWWVADDHTPTWQEACQRYELLVRGGSTAQAFNFKQPFGTDGQPMHIDRIPGKSKASPDHAE
jgi:hypothetical protein